MTFFLRLDDYENPTNMNSWYEIGLLHHTSGNLESAIASYDEALKIKPDFCEALENKNLALKELEKLK